MSYWWISRVRDFFYDVLHSDMKGSDDSLLKLKSVPDTNIVINNLHIHWEAVNLSLSCNVDHDRENIIHGGNLHFPIVLFQAAYLH